MSTREYVAGGRSRQFSCTVLYSFRRLSVHPPFCFCLAWSRQHIIPTSTEAENKSIHTMVDLLERLEALLYLEDVAYRTIDYLSPSYQQSLQQQYQNDLSCFDLQSAFTPTASSSSSSQSGINEVWREKICEWSYQVIDHFDFSREVVSVSIHYLDRFLATTPVNKKLFQLVAMTALYLAIKIYEPGNLSMKSMIELSRGYFSPAQMAEMEMAILRYVFLHASIDRSSSSPRVSAKKNPFQKDTSFHLFATVFGDQNPFSRVKIFSIWSRQNDFHWIPNIVAAKEFYPRVESFCQ